MGAPVAAADGRRFAGDRRQLDHCALCVADRRRGFADQLCQAAVHRADGDAGAGCGRSFDALLREPVGEGDGGSSSRTQVADSVSRVACMGLLAASAMIALGKPAIDLRVYGRAILRSRSAQLCRLLCGVFDFGVSCGRRRPSIREPFMRRGTLLLRWSPGPIVTVISLPIYAALFHWYGAMGLAFASDIGIAMQTLTIAGLLHQRHMVSLASLDYREMARCLGPHWRAGRLTWAAFSCMARCSCGTAAFSRARPSGCELAVLVAGLVCGGRCSLGAATNRLGASRAS